jgi:hypothetical protein
MKKIFSTMIWLVMICCSLFVLSSCSSIKQDPTTLESAIFSQEIRVVRYYCNGSEQEGCYELIMGVLTEGEEKKFNIAFWRTSIVKGEEVSDALKRIVKVCNAIDESLDCDIPNVRDFTWFNKIDNQVSCLFYKKEV